MRRRVGRATLGGMSSPLYRQLILEAAIDGSAIRGTLTAANGERRSFHGWLELNTALEAALMTGADHAPTGCPTGRQDNQKSDPQTN